MLVGNLGGRLKSGQFVSYPLKSYRLQFGVPEQREVGAAPKSNPTINALYCTLLNAIGHQRDTFNLGGMREAPALYGPLRELLA